MQPFPLRPEQAQHLRRPRIGGTATVLVAHDRIHPAAVDRVAQVHDGRLRVPAPAAAAPPRCTRHVHRLRRVQVAFGA
ncbi:hypothetical protein [Micromonospora mirobrigensis]|uniref:hypothetical protein n=1 Tax=Micromonospora mirobrigensis TaxID=262898 RepID=UPI000B87226F|nr:hypothetical protein [Micromonospora mirobrigensis]